MGQKDDDGVFMTQLFIKYQRLMLAEITKLVPEAWTAEDILQEALIRLSAKADMLRRLDENKKVSYIISAVRNNAKNYLRKQHRMPLVLVGSDTLEQLSPIDADADIERKLILQEQLRDLKSVWDILDDTSRFLLEGKYIRKRSNYELSKVLGIETASVRMLLTRARRKARSLMKIN